MLASAMVVSFTVPTVGTNVEAAAKKKPKLSYSEITMKVGQKKTIKLKNYTKLSKKKIKKVKWSTGNKKVATVTSSGKYKQQGKIVAKAAGATTVKLKYNNKTYKCKVTVADASSNTTEKVVPGTTTTEKTTPASTTEKTDVAKATDLKPTVPALDTDKSTDSDKTSSDNAIDHEHSFGDWVATKEPTCGEDGEKARSCSCGKEETQAIPKTNKHDYGEPTVIQKLTCSQSEISEKVCKVCGNVYQFYSNNNWEMGEHDYDENGFCKRCGDVDTTRINKFEYTIGENSVNNVNITLEQSDITNSKKYTMYIKQNGTGIEKGSDSVENLVNNAREKYDIEIEDAVILNEVYVGSSLKSSFNEMNSIEGLDKLVTSDVETMEFAFSDYQGNSISLSGLDLSNVKNLDHTFSGFTGTSIDLSGVNAANLESMYETFSCCRNMKTVDLTALNTPKLKNVHGLFEQCFSLEEIIGGESIDFSNVSSAGCMFWNCKKLTLINIPLNFTTDSLYYMFNGCESLLYLNLSDMNISEQDKYSFEAAFQNCYKLSTLNISNLDAKYFEKMDKASDYLFSGCGAEASSGTKVITKDKTAQEKIIEVHNNMWNALSDGLWSTDNVIY